MSGPSDLRGQLSEARRVVLKVGSRSLVGASLDEGARPGGGRFDALAAQIAAQREAERSVVVVSSGAVALGRGRLGFKERPRSVAPLQACAAVGQAALMRGWEDALETHGLTTAQLLLSHADLEDRARYLNARAALDALEELSVVPVINENDTVAVDEIRFGDNDQLAAMVCTLASADLLVLLTDIEGVLDEDGARISRLELGETLVERKGDAEAVGRGGMRSKVEAARRAARHGVPAVIADARDADALEKILAGHDVGTLVPPAARRLSSRKHWIAFTLRPRGDVILDDGACAALQAGGRSLLPAGVLGVRGDFSAGDAVALRAANGAEVARGLSRYGTEALAKLAGARTDEIRARLGYHGGDEVVHRDDLVLSEATEATGES